MQKVLIATMSLGIGGAETHIIELALELKRRGVDVSVASNGGVYVADLDRAGIPHHIVPMDRRSVGAMIKSYRLLKRIIKREKPDVVHAHARIPGFICGLIRKTVRFGFVTTAHWVFDAGHGLRYLTNWGEKTIAVSEDIKQYLIDSYGVEADNISVTINAINTNKFSAETSPAKIIEEFGLDPEKPIICNVSRLDENAAHATRLLVEIAPELALRLPGLQILIAGNGDIFDELSQKAASANAITGSSTVIMAGARTDIDEIVASCDLFVGASRAALEALSATKPVVVAGNEGFIGLFTPDKLEVAVGTNFCSRGCPLPTHELLLADITRFFEKTTEDDRQSLGNYGRELILKSYSITRMTDDCIAVYNSATERKYNVVLSGYYGFKNAGDDAILQSIHSNIKSSGGNVSITVLSSDPEDTRASYGFNAVHRFKIFRVLRALRRCDVLVSGGGSLLQDYTSTRSLLYYLFIINAAKRRGKKVMIYANGIGPVRKSANRRRVRRAVNRVDIITLRDPASAAELRDMGVTRDDIHVTADPVFTLDGAPREDALRILEERGVPAAPFIAVSIRDWPEADGFVESMAALCDEIHEKHGLNILFISMQSNKDNAISHRVRELMRNNAFVLEGRLAARELMGIIGVAELVLAMRLHALIFAARMNVPLAGIVYDQKVSAYIDALEMPSAGNVSAFDREVAFAAVELLINNRAEYIETLGRKSAGQTTAAREDADYLMGLLVREN